MGQFFMEQTKLAKEHELFHSMKSCPIVLSLQRYIQGRRRSLLWSFSDKCSFKKQVFLTVSLFLCCSMLVKLF
jgi:hypothetical protein